STAHLLGLGAFAIVMLGGFLVCRTQAGTRAERPRALLALAGLGALLLVASFPAYLILTSSVQIWRTQFLSGIGFAVLLASLIAIAAGVFSQQRVRLLVALAAAGVIAFFGAGAAYRAASLHYSIWVRHKDAMEDVLRTAPRVYPNTVIVYTGVPA